jgi:hypothetical protein
LKIIRENKTWRREIIKMPIFTLFKSVSVVNHKIWIPRTCTRIKTFPPSKSQRFKLSQMTF